MYEVKQGSAVIVSAVGQHQGSRLAQFQLGKPQYLYHVSHNSPQKKQKIVRTTQNVLRFFVNHLFFHFVGADQKGFVAHLGCLRLSRPRMSVLHFVLALLSRELPGAPRAWRYPIAGWFFSWKNPSRNG